MAKGSHTTFDGYPKSCHACQQPVRITGETPIWFETQHGEKRSFHFACYPKSPKRFRRPE